MYCASISNSLAKLLLVYVRRIVLCNGAGGLLNCTAFGTTEAGAGNATYKNFKVG